MISFNLFCALIAFYYPIISIALNTELFKIPNKKYIAINEKVTISCRAKDANGEHFMFKRRGLVMSLNCSLLYTEEQPIELKCGKAESWYYMNATIPKVSWKSRGEYQCIDDVIVKKLDLAVSVPPIISMDIVNVSYNLSPTSKYLLYKEEKISGTGSISNPFKLLSRDIKNVVINCSSQWAFPAAKYQWTITHKTMDGRWSEPESYRQTIEGSIVSNSSETEEMIRSSSVIKIDCLKFSGLINVECANVNKDHEELSAAQYHFLCPDHDSNPKANSSRVISKKMLAKVTTGEMVNIVIGCTIGMVLLISGIILICRHRTKDEMERYTMRQNNIEHSGYRV